MRRIPSHISLMAVCVTAFAATFCFGQNRFVQVPHYSAAGNLPTLLAQHDVNGDGHLDLVVLNVNTAAKTETVSLLLGTGTGGYEAPKTMATYPSSYGVPLAGDVNRDGHLDLIFSVSGTSPQTRVYLGTGETFETTAKVSPGVNCGSFPPVGCEMQLSDMNKDGNPDLVSDSVLGDGSLGIALMLGDGNGSFKAPVNVPGFAPFVIGDFNNDGIPDVGDTGFLNGRNGLQIQLGRGNGTFTQPLSLAYTYFNGEGGSFGVPVAADLRGNGDTDVILPLSDGSSCGSGGVLVLLGNGDGTFAGNPVSYGTGITYSIGGFTYGITVTDMNGDGKADIVVADQEGSSYSVFLNQGGGTFAFPVDYMAPQGVAGNFVVGDLTGNGRRDLTVSAQGGVDVFLNEGGGKLKAPGALEQDGIPGQTWAVDLNRDGIPDLEINLSVPSSCPGSKEPWAQALASEGGIPFVRLDNVIGLGDSTSISGGGDFNGDGTPDLLLEDLWIDGISKVLVVLFGDPGGGFPITGNPDEINDLGPNAVGDFNRDGKADVAAALVNGGGLQILLGDGGGGFNRARNYNIDPNPTLAFARDINGDGKLDIIIISQPDKVLQVLLGNGDGTFQATKTYDLPDEPVSLTFADFNNDGKLDIAVGGGSEVQVLLNNGNGTFKSPVSYAAGGPVSSIAAIDLTGNGNADVLVGDGIDNKIFLLTGNGKGTLSSPVDYYMGGGNPTEVVVADFNKDGAPDVVVGDATTQELMVLYNTGGTRVTLASSNKTPTAGQTVTFTATVAASVPGSGTPTGTVTFKNGSATLGTATLSGGKATFHTALLTIGTHSITAGYNGNTSFNPHASAAVTETVK